MSVDAATVRRIAHLARIAVAEAEIPHLQGELNAMLAFVEQLSEVDVEGVEPMTSVTPMEMKKRPDVVNDGEIADDIVRNAPATENHFFVVPKVVESVAFHDIGRCANKIVSRREIRCVCCVTTKRLTRPT